MAATGFTPVYIYASGTAGHIPLAANLTNTTNGSEIGLNYADGNLFFKNSSNSVITTPLLQSSGSQSGWLSSTDWTTFNGKQAALVSGTNIKTVNGTSLLGSGDVGTIDVSHGGTGKTSFSANQVLYGSFSQSSNLNFDGTNLAIGVASASTNLTIGGNGGNGLGFFMYRPGSANFCEIYDGTKTAYVGTDPTQTFIKMGALSAHDVAICTNNGPKMYVWNSGGVSIGNTTDPGAGNLSVSGNYIQSTAAKGINFTANTPLAGMTSQLLNWYEAGTFTPTIDGASSVGTGTYTTQIGQYTRIGNRVWWAVQIYWTAHTGTGAMRIGNLPFTANATATDAIIVMPDNITLTASNTCNSGYVIGGSKQAYILQQPVGGGALATITMDTNAGIYASGSYSI